VRTLAEEGLELPLQSAGRQPGYCRELGDADIALGCSPHEIERTPHRARQYGRAQRHA
jgi:hypothetical protein